MMWIIKPYKSVGQLEFNMSPQHIEELIGAPSDIQRGIPHVFTEFRFGKTAEEIKPSVQYRSGKVTSFEFYDSIPNVELNGFRIFENKKRIVNKWFKENSTNYAENEDTYVFLDFGIAMSKDQTWKYCPSINVFRYGDYDELIFNSEYGYTIVK